MDYFVWGETIHLEILHIFHSLIPLQAFADVREGFEQLLWLHVLDITRAPEVGLARTYRYPIFRSLLVYTLYAVLVGLLFAEVPKEQVLLEHPQELIDDFCFFFYFTWLAAFDRLDFLNVHFFKNSLK